MKSLRKDNPHPEKKKKRKKNLTDMRKIISREFSHHFEGYCYD